MNHTEVIREETVELLSKILMIQSDILANPTAETCILYTSTEQAFNALSETLDGIGEPFRGIAFSEDFNRSFTKFFTGSVKNSRLNSFILDRGWTFDCRSRN